MVIPHLSEVCYPWKVLAAIQASFPCSHPFSSLTGESGSKNSCQKAFNVIDKPFVSNEAPPLTRPNKTVRNLRIDGKTCWATCGIKQQEVSVSVTVTVDFYRWLCNPQSKSLEGREFIVLIPSPRSLLPCQQLLSHLQLSPGRTDFSQLFPFFLFFLSLELGKMFCFLLSGCGTLSIHDLPHCPFPICRAAQVQLEGGLVPSLDSCQEFKSSSWPDGLRFGSHS